VPETLRVGLALTNLNGIDYMIPILGSDEGGFNYTRSVDQKLSKSLLTDRRMPRSGRRCATLPSAPEHFRPPSVPKVSNAA
jgi:hypothetical protein